MFFKDQNFDNNFKPRYGFKALRIDKNRILIIGGGNNGFITDATIFSTDENSTCENYPITLNRNQNEIDEKNDELFEGLASFGAVYNKEGNEVLIFGGMMENRQFSDQLYRLKDFSNLKPVFTADDKCKPSARMGHSFTKIDSNRIVMFGGIKMRDSSDSKDPLPYFTNNTYILQINNGFYVWEKIKFDLKQHKPSPRESHTAVYHENSKSLIIHGGANGSSRLSDTWLFDTENYLWTFVETNGITPISRSMHSAVIFDDTMFIFGGFIRNDNSITIPWKCTNDVQCLNLNTHKWIHKHYRTKPEARAGHAAVESNGRIYIFSGRNDFTESKSFECLSDMWYVDVRKPLKVEQVELESAETNVLKIRWAKSRNTTCYLVEIRERTDDELMINNGNVQHEKRECEEFELPQVIVKKKAKLHTDEEMDMNKPKIVINSFKFGDIGGFLPTFRIDQFDGISADVDMNEAVNLNESTDSETETNKMRGSWCMVGIYKENTCTIKSYIAYKVNRSSLTSNNIPNLKGTKHINLVPGHAYFFRISGLNSCGIAKVSNIFGFKTKPDETSNVNEVIFDMKIECHIYYYLISWKTTLTNAEFLVDVEEQFGNDKNSKKTIYKGKNSTCCFSSDLLQQVDDNFLVHIQAHSSHQSAMLYKATMHYKDGIVAEILN